MHPNVISEDDHLLVLDKPAGLAMHAGIGTGYTLADWLCEQYPVLREVGEPSVSSDGTVIFRPGIVHRLDRETTGVLLVAKHQEMFTTLKKHFQKGKVEKEYHAFVYGRPKRSRGTVRLGIGKSRGDFRKQAVRHIRGTVRDACTEYVFVRSCAENTSFLSFYPQTGRMHQIRVHAQSLQTPIICDARYASKRPSLLGFDRLALHARRITIHTHHYAEPLTFIAPYPDDFSHALSLCE